MLNFFSMATWADLHCLSLNLSLCSGLVAMLALALVLTLLIFASLRLQANFVFSSDDDDPLLLLSLSASWLALGLKIEKTLQQSLHVRVHLGRWTLWQVRPGIAAKEHKAQKEQPDQRGEKQEKAQKSKTQKAGFAVRHMERISIDWPDLWPWLWRRIGEIDIKELRGNLDFACADPACTGQLDALFCALGGLLPGEHFYHRAMYGQKLLRSNLRLVLGFKPVFWALSALWWSLWHLHWQKKSASKVSLFFA